MVSEGAPATAERFQDLHRVVEVHATDDRVVVAGHVARGEGAEDVGLECDSPAGRD